MTPMESNRRLVKVPPSQPPADRGPVIVDLEPDRSAVPISHYLWILRRQMWRIVGFVVICVILSLIISLRMTPIYESTVTVDVDRRAPTTVVGQQAVQSVTNDADQFLATQSELIQSDSVLRPVVEKYRLLEREEEYGDLDPEDLQLYHDSPMELRQLKIKRPPNTYLLQISYGSSDRDLAANVANAIAQSYLEHTYNIRYSAAAGLSRFMEKQMEDLRADMERSSNALAKYERDLNIISPEEKTNVLGARLLELNSEFTRAQANRAEKEAAFHAIETGALDAAFASSQGDALRKLSEDRNSARQKFAEIEIHYGPNHPEFKAAKAYLEEVEHQLLSTSESIKRRVEVEYQKAVGRERALAKELQTTKVEFDKLNAKSFEYQALKREADGDKDLYEELLRKIKEETINASFQDNAARIADPALPGREPVFPNIPLNVLLTFLFSSFLAVGVAVVSDLVDDTIRDPEQVSKTLHTQVVGSLPEVKPWRGHISTMRLNGDSPHNNNGNSSLSSYEEAIRTLRNSILLTDFDRRLRTMLVTSASPSEGKSTIAMHLAIAHDQQHKRTLLIDGDLRRPSVHKRFSLKSDVGLSDVLVNHATWSETTLSPDGLEHLDIIPAGSASPRRAADFIGRGLEAIIEEASAKYDLIIVDAPPLLGFPEPLQMAAAVDGVVVVTRAGQTSRKAVALVLNTLSRLRANVVGLVLNEVNYSTSDSYYYYSYYRKYYHDRPSASGSRKHKI